MELFSCSSSISERVSDVDLDGIGVDVEGIVEVDEDGDDDEDDFLVEFVFVLLLPIESSDDSIISEFGFLFSGFLFSAILLYIMNIIYILLILY